MLVPVTGHLPNHLSATPAQIFAPQESAMISSNVNSFAVQLVKPMHLHKISNVQPLGILIRCCPYKSLLPVVVTSPLYFSVFFLVSVFSVFEPLAEIISLAGASILMWHGSSFISAACSGYPSAFGTMSVSTGSFAV